MKKMLITESQKYNLPKKKKDILSLLCISSFSPFSFRNVSEKMSEIRIFSEMAKFSRHDAGFCSRRYDVIHTSQQFTCSDDKGCSWYGIHNSVMDSVPRDSVFKV